MFTDFYFHFTNSLTFTFPSQIHNKNKALSVGSFYKISSSNLIFTALDLVRTEWLRTTQLMRKHPAQAMRFLTKFEKIWCESTLFGTRSGHIRPAMGDFF